MGLANRTCFRITHSRRTPFVMGDGGVGARILNAGFGMHTHTTRRGIITALLGNSVHISLPQRGGRNFVLGPKRVLGIGASALRTRLARSSSPQSMLL